MFATDQEGATWLPNGNPFDELLHIQSGRHYGFPPRHPQHLPNVIDEPSTFDYGPQHQSTCGLNFNEPSSTGRIFGPPSWRGNAFVCGYSRGKLFRTELVKTRAGYVAANHLLACLSRLTVDACVSPQGDLLVATHSGQPDWGSGPAGKGTLYKILYADPQVAQPVFAWPSGEREVRVAFDRALEPQDLQSLAKDVRIEQGAWLRAGDRFESMRPGYAAVQMQMMSPRTDLVVRSVQVTADRRTLLIETDPHRWFGHYGITLSKAEPTASATVQSPAVLPQQPTIDLDYTLNGVIAAVQSRTGEPLWDGWLPHLDLTVAKRFTAGSALHDALWKLQGQGSILTLQSDVDLSNMLRAVTQPGSRLDFDYPPETVSIDFSSKNSLQLRADGVLVPTSTNADGRFTARCVAENPSKPVSIEITLASGPTGEFDLDVAWHTNEDSRDRPLPLRRLILPWANRAKEDGQLDRLVNSTPPELLGGRWGSGRQIFFGEKAQCSKCHSIFGRGEHVGPDLSNLVYRDYQSVLRDITQPTPRSVPTT